MYQFSDPADVAAIKLTVPEPHREAGVVLVTDGISLIVASTKVLAEEQQ